jgi:bifunctional non-homologous end joining protein LigD
VKIERQEVSEKRDFEIDDCTIQIGDVGREIWKGISKADLINYYHQVSKYILPYLTNRPLSLHIKPLNAVAPGFYIKDMEGHQPECSQIFTDRRRHEVKGKSAIIDYLVCKNEATLLWMVNIGCIDINPWNSRVTAPQSPDFIAIDLDPADDDQEIARPKLIETAMAAKEYCDKKKLTAFVKTSGKTGIHFFIPCSGFTNKVCRTLAEQICSEIQAFVPAVSTTENRIASRGGKVYLDPSQNDYADTLASVYSVRPYYLPTISAPLEWKEVNAKLELSAFSIKDILPRITKKGDLFADILNIKIMNRNNRILAKL